MSGEQYSTTPKEKTGSLDIHRQAALITGPECRLDTFASLLAHQEVILHVGTSLAEAGDEIAFTRGDVHWYNVDPSYENRDGRYNYEFIQSDIDHLDEHFKEGEFNRIYCYGLTDPDTQKAQEIANKLYKYLKLGGTVKVGPVSESEWRINIASRMLEYKKPHGAEVTPAKQPYIPRREDKFPRMNKNIHSVVNAINVSRDIGRAVLDISALVFRK